MTRSIERLLILFLVVGALAACESVPPMNFSVPNVGPSSVKLDAELRSITVTTARPDEKTGDLELGVETLTPLWKTALEEALNRMAIFRDDVPAKVNLSVKVLKLDVPAAGVSFTTKTEARYEILDRETGGIIFTADIATEGTTPADFAFLGLARARESVNRSVQNNIARFLQALETVDLTKPMFPAAPSSLDGRTAEPTS